MLSVPRSSPDRCPCPHAPSPPPVIPPRRPWTSCSHGGTFPKRRRALCDWQRRLSAQSWCTTSPSSRGTRRFIVPRIYSSASTRNTTTSSSSEPPRCVLPGARRRLSWRRRRASTPVVGKPFRLLAHRRTPSLIPSVRADVARSPRRPVPSRPAPPCPAPSLFLPRPAHTHPSPHSPFGTRSWMVPWT